jgi:hypothetical protein
MVGSIAPMRSFVAQPATANSSAHAMLERIKFMVPPGRLWLDMRRASLVAKF